MIDLLRRLTILKRLFIMLLLAAIGTVVFGSFSVKEQYNHLVEEKQKQLSAQVSLLSNTLSALQQQQPLSENHLLSLINQINYLLETTQRLQLSLFDEKSNSVN